jgi:hypothetical protein
MVRFGSVLRQKFIQSKNKFICDLVRFLMTNKKYPIWSNFMRFNLDRVLDIRIIN